ncbi:unnamed protein product, partial [Nippostrongylus brasiliensis]|uniref:VWFA domain-containing protein n=1 Tax=Nippostrongylus brasiliensis TaxID=27835 RepID=A0A0N4XS24_NIPBR
GEDGKPIPTDASGVPLDKDGGEPLPTDSSGNYVTAAKDDAVSKTLPTDESGNVIYPVTKPDGSPLPTDASGNFVTDDGVIIRKDEEGRPIGPDGEVLPTDQTGSFVYVADGSDQYGDRKCSAKGLKLDIVFAVLTQSMTKNEFDSVIQAISLFADEIDLSPDVTRIGLVYGNKELFVPLTLGGYQEKEHMRDELRQIAFTEDSSDDGIPVYDAVKQQFVIFPRADCSKVAIVVAKILTSLPQDEDGVTHLFITSTKHGDNRVKQLESIEKLGANSILQLIEHHCKSSPIPLPEVDQTKVEEQRKAVSGSDAIQDRKTAPTDESGNVIYPVTKPDGSPLPTDASGNFVTDEGTVVE